VQACPFFLFFCSFFYCTKIGPKLKRPDLALDTRRCPRSGERASAQPQTHSALGRGRASHAIAGAPDPRRSPRPGAGARRVGFPFFFCLAIGLCWQGLDAATSILDPSERLLLVVFFFLIDFCRLGLEARAREQTTTGPMEFPSRNDRDSFEEW
jgi:hypothetical protein